jgi:DNA-binding GntR family transcriptional regulator
VAQIWIGADTSGDLNESVAGTSQTDLAYERLSEAIIGLDLKPGALYTEAQLAEFVGLGRTPVREALHRLIREELVSTRRNRGIQVTPIDVIRQLQLLDVRRALERLLAERACAQATEQERREMLRLADVTEASAADNDIKAFLAVNRDVQDLKARAAHNEILQSTMDLFFGLSRRFWVAYSPRIPESLQTASRLHARVLRAIAVADRDAAASSTNELLDFLEEFTRRTIDLRIAVG